MESLDKLESILDVPKKAKGRILAELRSHCEEARDELTEAGATQEEATLVASERLGSPEELAGDFLVVHGPGLRSFLLLLAPFFLALLGRLHHHLAPVFLALPARIHYSLAFSDFAKPVDVLLKLACLAMLAGTGWGIVQRRKPVWLSSWLAGSILAFIWLGDRLDPAFGGTLGLHPGAGLLTLLPATLSLWFYRRKQEHRLYVFALWVTLVIIFVLLWWLPPPVWRAGSTPTLLEWWVHYGSFTLQWALHAVAWTLLAAAMAPQGRSAWAIYSSLSTFVYMVSPPWWMPDFAARFWATVAIGPMAIWGALYFKKPWTKIAVLASAVMLIDIALMECFPLSSGSQALWHVGIVYSILPYSLQAAIVVAPLLLWRRREGRASGLLMADR